MLSGRLREWKVKDLVETAKVSLGLVSKVRKGLIDRQLAVERPTGLRLRDPAKLLAMWGQSYLPGERMAKFYTPLHGTQLDAALAAAMREAPGEVLFSSFSAARWIAPFARQGTTFLYSKGHGLEALRKHLRLQKTAGGENVVISQDPDEDVFAAAVEPAPGVFITGTIHTWLDLNASGERGAEAAEHLLREVILPGWSE
jgi:hypothetical protein